MDCKYCQQHMLQQLQAQQSAAEADMLSALLGQAIGQSPLAKPLFERLVRVREIPYNVHFERTPECQKPSDFSEGS